MYKSIFNVIAVAAVSSFLYIGCGDNSAGIDDDTKIPKDSTENPSVPAPTKTTFQDNRDGHSYRKVAIGSQVWMSENLYYDAEGSVCYNNSADSCAKYGRLYTWAAAEKACPTGWHLPSDAEWTVLVKYVGGAFTAGGKLKSTSGWYGNSGTDEYGFSALPGGVGGGDGSFELGGVFGYWWSSSAIAGEIAVVRYMNGANDEMGSSYFCAYCETSVRCVED